MTIQVKVLIGGLVAAVAILSVALSMVLIDGDDDDFNMGISNDSYMGMMQAMGRMDSDRMLSMMRSILGEEGYQRMVQHLSEHRNGMQSTYDNSPGGMMHQMMDGMMQRMPRDKNQTMPMMSH